MSEPGRDLDPRPRAVLQLGEGQTQTVRFDVPTSMAARYDVWIAAGTNFQRACTAAFGLCTSDPRLLPKVAYRGDVLAYGGAVLDHLLAIKVPYASIRAASAIAYDLVTDGLAELSAEVDAAEGNSAAPSATSTA